MTASDWNLQGARLAAFRFAEWLTINNSQARKLDAEYGAGVEQAWEAAEAHGWVETVLPTRDAACNPGYVPWPYPRLTAEGLLKVDEARCARTDRIARVAACRQAILLWLSAEGGPAPSLAVFSRSAYRFYETSFAKDEAHAAAGYLIEKGLVRGWPYPPDGLLMELTLTARGIDCVEIYGGDVRRFYNPSQPGGRVTNNQHNNFYGGNAQAAQGEHITQTQAHGVDAMTLAAILQPMRDALTRIEDADERGDVEHAIRELESAASDGDVEEAKQRAGRLERLVSKVGTSAGNAALAGAVSAGIRSLLAALGVSGV